MAFEIDSRLNTQLLGVAWMLGHWEGTGNGHHLGGEDFTFSVTVDFAENGGTYMHYIMQLFETDEQGRPTRSLGMETGFWRPKADGEIEVVIVQPEGVAEVYVGRIEGAKIELTTDLVARTVTSEIPATGGHRLYGNVESDLMFTYDRGTTEHEVQPHLWARLARA
ncbi:MAG: FABP family protein [Propionibacteriaceae bacterium]|nr:FABP family protein [Propionibacteriaceae bacterium]